jgi:hypothetical protein
MTGVVIRNYRRLSNVPMPHMVWAGKFVPMAALFPVIWQKRSAAVPISSCWEVCWPR